MDFLPFAAMLALIWKVVDFAKYARNRDTNAVVIQLVVWVTGVAVVALYAASDFGAGLRIGGQVLGELNAASLVAVGLSVGSSASAVVDFKKARDNNDSAVVPPLLGP